MKVAFVYSDKALEKRVAKAFIAGVSRVGDEVRPVERGTEIPLDADVVLMIGVKTRRIWDKVRAAGAHAVMIDRGYLRNHTFYRVAINDQQPTAYLETARHTSERWDALRVQIQPWRKGRSVVIAGSSEKFHLWYGLDHPTKFAQRVVAEVKQRSKREIVYRPKPSWDGKTPIPGTQFSTRPGEIERLLSRAHVLVTYGSNACFEAMVMGVPTIVLGNAIARPISSTSLDDIESPRRASDAERRQLLANLAWCQFSLAEMADGFAWRHLREQLDAGDVLHHGG